MKSYLEAEYDLRKKPHKKKIRGRLTGNTVRHGQKVAGVSDQEQEVAHKKKRQLSYQREKGSWKFEQRELGKEIKYHERWGARRRPYDSWPLDMRLKKKPQQGFPGGSVGNGLIHGVTEYEVQAPHVEFLDYYAGQNANLAPSPADYQVQDVSYICPWAGECPQAASDNRWMCMHVKNFNHATEQIGNLIYDKLRVQWKDSAVAAHITQQILSGPKESLTENVNSLAYQIVANWRNQLASKVYLMVERMYKDEATVEKKTHLVIKSLSLEELRKVVRDQTKLEEKVLELTQKEEKEQQNLIDEVRVGHLCEYQLYYNKQNELAELWRFLFPFKPQKQCEFKYRQQYI